MSQPEPVVSKPQEPTVKPFIDRRAAYYEASWHELLLFNLLNLFSSDREPADIERRPAKTLALVKAPTAAAVPPPAPGGEAQAVNLSEAVKAELAAPPLAEAATKVAAMPTPVVVRKSVLVDEPRSLSKKLMFGIGAVIVLVIAQAVSTKMSDSKPPKASPQQTAELKGLQAKMVASKPEAASAAKGNEAPKAAAAEPEAASSDAVDANPVDNSAADAK